MTTALLAVVVVAGLACPAHMLWRMRTGRRSGCAPEPEQGDSTHLGERQRSLAVRIERARAAESGDAKYSAAGRS